MPLRLLMFALPFVLKGLRGMRPRNWKQRIILLIVVSSLGYMNEEFGRFSVFSDRVIDGDTFVMDNTKIRIWGIDTPERDQFGYEQATLHLKKIIKKNELNCIFKKRDVYRRSLMRCDLEGGQDLGAQMVLSGWAKDFTKYSDGYYKKQEYRARDLKRGLWSQ